MDTPPCPWEPSVLWKSLGDVPFCIVTLNATGDNFSF